MEDLSLHILDIAENCLRAQATLVEILINEDTERSRMEIIIKDNGRGMDPETLKKAKDPFFTTRKTRRFGLGFSLFEESAKMTEGEFEIRSEPGKGTEVTAAFNTNHIDMKPLKNMAETIVTLIQGYPDADFFYRHAKDGKEIVLDTVELKKELEGIPLQTPEVIAGIKKSLTREEESLARMT